MEAEEVCTLHSTILCSVVAEALGGEAIRRYLVVPGTILSTLEIRGAGLAGSLVPGIEDLVDGRQIHLVGLGEGISSRESQMIVANRPGAVSYEHQLRNVMRSDQTMIDCRHELKLEWSNSIYDQCDHDVAYMYGFPFLSIYSHDLASRTHSLNIVVGGPGELFVLL